jgi:hypothetical protein
MTAATSSWQWCVPLAKFFKTLAAQGSQHNQRRLALRTAKGRCCQPGTLTLLVIDRPAVQPSAQQSVEGGVLDVETFIVYPAPALAGSVLVIPTRVVLLTWITGM